MKLLVIFVCVALFVFVKGESEVEVEEMEHVEEETERGCVGKWDSVTTTQIAVQECHASATMLAGSSTNANARNKLIRIRQSGLI
uniref:U43-Deinotoxin-Dsu1aq_1 n=1 Tax=Deinopis subrufa TaxID=1905329 RepID=A0A4V2H9C2_DEISU